jgi:hypothetical protein
MYILTLHVLTSSDKINEGELYFITEYMKQAASLALEVDCLYLARAALAGFTLDTLCLNLLPAAVSVYSSNFFQIQHLMAELCHVQKIASLLNTSQ